MWVVCRSTFLTVGCRAHKESVYEIKDALKRSNGFIIVLDTIWWLPMILHNHTTALSRNNATFYNNISLISHSEIQKLTACKLGSWFSAPNVSKFLDLLYLWGYSIKTNLTSNICPKIIPGTNLGLYSFNKIRNKEYSSQNRLETADYIIHLH